MAVRENTAIISTLWLRNNNGTSASAENIMNSDADASVNGVAVILYLR